MIRDCISKKIIEDFVKSFMRQTKNFKYFVRGHKLQAVEIVHKNRVLYTFLLNSVVIPRTFIIMIVTFFL